ncbi:malate dehydrogenase oxaloacetate-decarboxylating [Trichoderma cornu-damae]|uniref:Malic enzyme n=1 Tax=Trichoderma cornu-damae TaxID=654480 RepID=A0A9P8TXM8_9HYPO|nr:malate dehydrogenase oxaloacetate-decarboxylating [Trichoderma cornu-damae]
MAPTRSSKFGNLPLSTVGPLDCALTGTALLNSPVFNKGSAFTQSERRDFNLTGLLPANEQSLEHQVERAYQQYLTRSDDLAKNTFLTSLRDQNEVLYFKLLLTHLKEMFSVVYTPTEGDAIQNYSRLFRRPEGCFLDINHPENVHQDLALWGTPDDVDYICVTDGEEILGIGDQGVGGILISGAKLTLASLCAGVHPSRTLPVVIDCGTDNEELLKDKLYLGLRQRRVRGKRYDDFIQTFVEAARKLFPGAYLHFEDFGLRNARRLLELYRPKIACFNDDVQGTGCVTLAAIMAALHASGQKLGDVRVIIFGAGSAGVGIADQVRDAIAAELNVDHEKASQQIWLIDKPGLLTSKLDVSDAQKTYVKDASGWGDNDTHLLSVVKRVKPNILIGTSTVPGAFTQEIVKAMHENSPRPIIFPLSNPTRLHEATPADLLKWTDGKALVATGSPFDPVTGPWGEGGNDATIEIAECNNSVVFPGIGLGCILSRARLLTDRMLVAAVQGVASLSPVLKDPTAPLLPDVEEVRTVSVQVAKSVIRAAVEEGVAAEKDIPTNDHDLDAWVREQMWNPEYRPLRLVKMDGATRAAKGELGKAMPGL